LEAAAETLCFKTSPEGIAAMCEEFEVGKPVELTEEDMDRLIFHDTEEDGDLAPEGGTRSFREQLAQMIAEGAEFPCFFATTEF